MALQPKLFVLPKAQSEIVLWVHSLLGGPEVRALKAPAGVRHRSRAWTMLHGDRGEEDCGLAAPPPIEGTLAARAPLSAGFYGRTTVATRHVRDGCTVWCVHARAFASPLAPAAALARR